MSQFGGSPRDQDYGFFTTPARTAVSTSQFGSTAVETKPAPRPAASPGADERPAPAFGLPAPAHRADAGAIPLEARPPAGASCCWSPWSPAVRSPTRTA